MTKKKTISDSRLSPAQAALLRADILKAQDAAGQQAALQKYHLISRTVEADIERRVKLAAQGNGDFTDFELLYAATVYCSCGAGMAYPEGVGAFGAWECSAILKGEADRETIHTPPLSFNTHSVISETSPRGNGNTTRPDGTVGRYLSSYSCGSCGFTSDGVILNPAKRGTDVTECGKCGDTDRLTKRNFFIVEKTDATQD